MRQGRNMVLSALVKYRFGWVCCGGMIWGQRRKQGGGSEARVAAAWTGRQRWRAESRGRMGDALGGGAGSTCWWAGVGTGDRKRAARVTPRSAAGQTVT